MNRPDSTSEPFAPAAAALIYKYKFGPAEVNAPPVAGNESLFVSSPPYRPPPAAYDDLARHGEIRALVASNAFHNTAIPAWKARFPAAQVFAPAQAVAREAFQRGRPRWLIPAAGEIHEFEGDPQSAAAPVGTS